MENLYENKCDNPEEIYMFLEPYSPSKLNQAETDNVNRLIARSKLESVIKNSLQMISPGPDCTGKFYQIYKKFMLILHKGLPKD